VTLPDPGVDGRAIGANIPILEPAGHMICDIAGDHRDLGHLPGRHGRDERHPRGGDEFDEAIIKHVRNVHNLIIGEATAENVKITSATPRPTEDREIEIKGTDAITGLPRKLEMDSVEVREGCWSRRPPSSMRSRRPRPDAA